jgi:predicted DNA-binding protein
VSRKAIYKRYNVHLTEEQITRMEVLAQHREMKTSEVIREAITKYAEAWDKKLSQAATA